MLFSCGRYSIEDFSFERQDYLGEELRTDGFFYQKFSSTQYEMFFLYRNGVVYGPHIYPASSVQELEESLEARYSAPPINDGIPSDWGIFQIIGNEIIMENWGQGNSGPDPVIRRDGIIFGISDINFGTEDGGIYEFLSSPFKRDSTNQWID